MIKLESGKTEGAKEFWRSVYISAIMGTGGRPCFVASEWAAKVADKAVEDAIERGAVR